VREEKGTHGTGWHLTDAAAGCMAYREGERRCGLGRPVDTLLSIRHRHQSITCRTDILRGVLDPTRRPTRLPRFRKQAWVHARTTNVRMYHQVAKVPCAKTPLAGIDTGPDRHLDRYLSSRHLAWLAAAYPRSFNAPAAHPSRRGLGEREPTGSNAVSPRTAIAPTTIHTSRTENW
jgi:hypothetical protein